MTSARSAYGPDEPISDPLQPEAVAERLVGLGPERYTAGAIAAMTDATTDEVLALWTAMGFAAPAPDAVIFTDDDVEVLVAIRGLVVVGLVGFDQVVGMTRVLSQALGRIADAEAGAIRQRVRDSPAIGVDLLSGDPATENLARGVIKALERFLVHSWRRHLVHALVASAAFAPSSDAKSLAVGFADIVGFTRLSRRLEEPELYDLIEAFERRAQRAAAETGGRIVKSLGDEVMFVGPDAETAVEIGLRIIHSTGGDPRVRVGVAMGKVIPHRGDYYGAVVNLANRAAREAQADAVFVTAAVKEALAKDRYSMRMVGPKWLKGIGPTPLWSARRTRRVG